MGVRTTAMVSSAQERCRGVGAADGGLAGGGVVGDVDACLGELLGQKAAKELGGVVDGDLDGRLGLESDIAPEDELVLGAVARDGDVVGPVGDGAGRGHRRGSRRRWAPWSRVGAVPGPWGLGPGKKERTLAWKLRPQTSAL